MRKRYHKSRGFWASTLLGLALFAAAAAWMLQGVRQAARVSDEEGLRMAEQAVRQAADFYKISPDRVLVVSDDTALPVGRLRIRVKGSAGGHNGLKNIIQHLGTDQFPRLRVGVGEKPHPDYDMADWVLGKFVGEDKKAIDAAVKRAADAIECILAEGIDRGMGKFNG